MYKILSLATVAKDAKVACFETAESIIREKIQSEDYRKLLCDIFEGCKDVNSFFEDHLEMIEELFSNGRLEYNDTEKNYYGLVTRVQALIELILSQSSRAALLLISTPKMSSPLRFTDEEIMAKESNGVKISDPVLDRRKILMKLVDKKTVGIVNVITDKENFNSHSEREQMLTEKGILFLKDDTQDLCGATMLFKLGDSILKVGIEQGQFDSTQTKRIVNCEFYETLESVDYSEVLKCSNTDPRLKQMLEKFA